MEPFTDINLIKYKTAALVGLAEWESGFLFSELGAFFNGIRNNHIIDSVWK